MLRLGWLSRKAAKRRVTKRCNVKQTFKYEKGDPVKMKKENTKKMEATKTDITVIMDRSGSMQAMQKEAVESFNQFIDSQQEASGKAKFSLVQFNHVVEQLISGIPMSEAERLGNESYVPNGRTALLDSVGHTIVETKKRLAGKKKWQVVIVVITDGMENASREYSGKEIKKLIKKCEEKLGWKFIFLAADPTSFEQHAAYGFEHQRALMTGRGGDAYVEAVKLASAKLTSVRFDGNTDHLAFTDEERESAKKRDQEK